MLFVVDFLHSAAQKAKQQVIHSIEFEADDLFSVVERTRIILESKDFDPFVDRFQISATTGSIIYQEIRDNGERNAPNLRSGPNTSDVIQHG